MHLLCLLAVQTPELRRTMAAGPRDAVLMAPPLAVGAASAKRMFWTADGGYLVILRESAPGVTPPMAELIVWGRRSGKVRSLATFDPATTKVNELLPMGGSDRFVLDERQTVRNDETATDYDKIVLVSASSGAFIPLSLQKAEKGGPLIDAYPSPSRPVAILERIDVKEKRLRAFGPDGRLGPEIVVTRTDGFDFDADGYPRQIRRIVDPKTGKGRTEARRIDLATGAVADWKPWTRRRESEEEAPLAIRSLPLVSPKGVRASGVLLLLKAGKDDESGIVSTDGEQPILSPKGDAVAYSDQGLAMVRVLTRVDRKVYDEALRAQQIAEAVQRAKGIGVGLLILATDTKDVLPGQGVDINSMLGPYLKNDSLLQGFTYTFGGGDIGDVETPAETVVGYVSGPGGRAAIYVDGHAKWIPDGP